MTPEECPLREGHKDRAEYCSLCGWTYPKEGEE